MDSRSKQVCSTVHFRDSLTKATLSSAQTTASMHKGNIPENVERCQNRLTGFANASLQLQQSVRDCASINVDVASIDIYIYNWYSLISINNKVND